MVSALCFYCSESNQDSPVRYIWLSEVKLSEMDEQSVEVCLQYDVCVCFMIYAGIKLPFVYRQKLDFQPLAKQEKSVIIYSPSCHSNIFSFFCGTQKVNLLEISWIL